MKSNTVHPMITSASLQTIKQSSEAQAIRQEEAQYKQTRKQARRDSLVTSYFYDAKKIMMEPDFEENIKTAAVWGDSLPLITAETTSGCMCIPFCCCGSCVISDDGNSEILHDVAKALMNDAEVSQKIPAGARFTTQSSPDCTRLQATDVHTVLYLDWSTPCCSNIPRALQMK